MDCTHSAAKWGMGRVHEVRLVCMCVQTDGSVLQLRCDLKSARAQNCHVLLLVLSSSSLFLSLLLPSSFFFMFPFFALLVSCLLMVLYPKLCSFFRFLLPLLLYLSSIASIFLVPSCSLSHPVTSRRGCQMQRSQPWDRMRSRTQRDTLRKKPL